MRPPQKYLKEKSVNNSKYIIKRLIFKKKYDIITVVEQMEVYRSGHNEAVLKTVWVIPTGVRIPPLPPQKAHLSVRFLHGGSGG